MISAKNQISLSWVQLPFLPMHVFFADDSVQRKPTRAKAGELVAVGGVAVAEDKIADLEKSLEKRCKDFGFPPGEMFKWSPGKEHWMRTNLVDAHRAKFFQEILAAAAGSSARAVFICCDNKCAHANARSKNCEEDAVTLLIERIDYLFVKAQTTGLIVVDRHSGDMKTEEKFLTDSLETIRAGTKYVQPKTIILPMLSSPSRLCRILQLADLVTSATLARVAGETKWSPPLMDHIIPLFAKELNRVGGVGVKLHPFQKYGNLYHWIFRDSHYVKGNTGYPYPLTDYAFSKDEHTY